MCLAQGPQRSDAGEARTRGPSVSSQALYHWATALPVCAWKKKVDLTQMDAFWWYLGKHIAKHNIFNQEQHISHL